MGKTAPPPSSTALDDARLGALLTPVEGYLRACGLVKTAAALRAERKLRAHRDLVAASDAAGEGASAAKGEDAAAARLTRRRRAAY